jgi:hypothetical protein
MPTDELRLPLKIIYDEGHFGKGRFITDQDDVSIFDCSYLENNQINAIVTAVNSHAALESRLVEAQSLLEEKDEIENDLKTLKERLAVSEHRVTELEALAEAVEFVESNEMLNLNYYGVKRGDCEKADDRLDKWELFHCDNPENGSNAPTFRKVVADYREKHPELKEDEATELLKESLLAIEKEIELFGHGQTIRIRDMRKKLRAFLTRKKGESHAD